MKRIISAGVILTALAFSAASQDWYHDREERFRGEEWRPHIFTYVRTDLEHIWSAVRASDEERRRLGRERFKVYRDLKLPLETHQMDETADV